MCISVVNSYSQGYFIYVNGEKLYFEISSNEVVVKIDEKMREDAIENAFRSNGTTSTRSQRKK